MPTERRPSSQLVVPRAERPSDPPLRPERLPLPPPAPAPPSESSAVGAVLADLEQRSSVSMSAAPTALPTLPDAPRRSRAGNFLLALLVLIIAGGAAAVVYFALPYLT
jgi:hypothetical protein